MGKTTRWLKRFVAKLRSDSNPKDKRSLAKSFTDKSSSVPSAGDAISSYSPAPAVRLQSPAVEVSEYGADEARKHAIAVAEASAAAAQAALTAAQAAAAVVRLTASGRHYAAALAHACLGGARDTRAALVIQSHFRGYLARRALRALKGLVKLQALVRGHIMRKKTAETMRSIEAMLRAQERARSMRAYDSPISSDKSPQFYYTAPQTREKLEQISYSKISSNTQSPISKGPLTPEKLEQASYSRITSNTQSPISKGSGSRSIISRVIIHPDKGYINSPAWSEESQLDESNLQHQTDASCSTEEDYDLQADKILEIDTGKNLDPSIEDEEEEEIAFCTAENSPHFYPASSRRQSPMTPTKSDTSAASCPIGYSDCPRSYMTYTESSRAKMRSLSAPRQRPQQCNERAGLKRGLSIHQKAVSSAVIRGSSASKAYIGSGRLDGLGMPVRNNAYIGSVRLDELGMPARNNSRRFAIVDV